MRRFTTGVCVLACSTLVPITAEAQLFSCGSAESFNDSWQYQTARAVESIVQTKRPNITLCAYKARVEAWVSGVGGASSDEGATLAEVHLITPVPVWGSYSTYGKHWQIQLLTGVWEYAGTTRHDTILYAPITGEQRCRDLGGSWDGYSCSISNCPIIVDTAQNGYRLTGAAEGVRFDLDDDGTPELLGWTEPDSDDCFLALDRNGNGRIDSGRELFGNRTPAHANAVEPTTADGFEALKFLEFPDYGASTADLTIDRHDAAFARLLLWCDGNHNGLSESSELTSAAEAGLVSIGTDGKSASRRDSHGNQFRLRAKALWANGEHYVSDVWLVTKQ